MKDKFGGKCFLYNLFAIFYTIFETSESLCKLIFLIHYLIWYISRKITSNHGIIFILRVFWTYILLCKNQNSIFWLIASNFVSHILFIKYISALVWPSINIRMRGLHDKESFAIHALLGINVEKNVQKLYESKKIFMNGKNVFYELYLLNTSASICWSSDIAH